MMGIKETFKGIYLRWGPRHIIIPISTQQYIWSVGLMYNLWYRIQRIYEQIIISTSGIVIAGHIDINYKHIDVVC